MCITAGNINQWNSSSRTRKSQLIAALEEEEKEQRESQIITSHLPSVAATQIPQTPLANKQASTELKNRPSSETVDEEQKLLRIRSGCYHEVR